MTEDADERTQASAESGAKRSEDDRPDGDDRSPRDRANELAERLAGSVEGPADQEPDRSEE